MKEIKKSYLSLVSIAIKSLILLFIPVPIQAVKIYFSKYTYNNDTLIIKTGVFKQEQTSIAFYRLQDIQTNQSLFGQILKYGTITLYSKDRIVTMNYVDNPENVANELRELMIKSKKENGLKVTELQ